MLGCQGAEHQDVALCIAVALLRRVLCCLSSLDSARVSFSLSSPIPVPPQVPSLRSFPLSFLPSHLYFSPSADDNIYALLKAPLGRHPQRSKAP